MKFGESLWKWVTYFFITFIILIIVISFGMPQFIGLNAESDKHIAARIGDEIIVRSELANTVDRVARNPNFKGLAAQRNFLTQYVLNQLISEKLQMTWQKESGFYPLGEGKFTVLANFYKENFPKYQTNSGFDFTRFDKEFLKQRRISRATLENEAFRQTVYQNQNLLSNFTPVSSYEKNDMASLENTTVPLQILSIDQDQKKIILKNLLKITDADILARFKKNYLSKNKNEKLTQLKREAITQAIINERRASVEKKWMKDLKTEAGNLSIYDLNRKYGGTLTLINQYRLSDNLSQSAKNPKLQLNPLQENADFIKALASKQINKAFGPWEIESNLYIVSFGPMIKKPATALPEAGQKEEEEKIGKENNNNAAQFLDTVLRKEVKIIKYNKLAD